MSTTKKLIMKKTILVILILLTASEINAQQDPQYTQYMYNMNVINPAYAGSSDATSIGILYRDQWEGLEGAPKTATMNLHFPAGNNIGFSEQKSSSELDDGEQENASISDKESSKKCRELQNKYNVVLGVSWGTLPYDLQTVWKTHECDYHLSDSSSLISQSEYKGQFND